MADTTYQTTNLLESLSLYLAGCKIKGVQPTGTIGTKIMFIFEKDLQLTRTLEYYEKKELKFDPEHWLKGMRQFSQIYHIDWSRWQ